MKINVRYIANELSTLTLTEGGTSIEIDICSKEEAQKIVAQFKWGIEYLEDFFNLETITEGE